MKNNIKKFLALILLVVFVGTTGAVIHFPKTWWKDIFMMPFIKTSQQVVFRIKPGESASNIADTLVTKQIVVDKNNLLHYMINYGVDRKLRPGLYSFIPGPSWKVAKQFMVARPLVTRVTIIPGSPLNAYFDFRSAPVSHDVKGPLARKNFPLKIRDLLPEKVKERSAFLLPETYDIAENKPDLLVKQASFSWLKCFAKQIPENSKKLKDLSIIASLVEMESLLDVERPRISGVIYNRIKKGMPLQIDATVIYAWKIKGKKLKRVRYKDLKIDSDYNTYIKKGLPPGPICIPSKESWEAAFSPERHNYLYYVADGKGSHVFSKSYREHKKAIKKIRKK